MMTQAGVEGSRIHLEKIKIIKKKVNELLTLRILSLFELKLKKKKKRKGKKEALQQR